MQFGLLLSRLPHVQESRVHYDSMLMLHVRDTHAFVPFWRRLKARVRHLS